jgi:hypothetical protein
MTVAAGMQQLAFIPGRFNPCRELRDFGPATGKQTRFLGSRNSSVSGTSEGTLARRLRRRRIARPEQVAIDEPSWGGANRLMHRRRVVARMIEECGTPTGRTFDFTRLRCPTGYGFPATAVPEQRERGPLPVSRRLVVTKGINNGRQLQRVLREMQGQT